MRCAKEYNSVPSFVSISDSIVPTKSIRCFLNVLVNGIVERVHKSLKELSAKYLDLEALRADGTCLISIPPKLCPSKIKGRFGSFPAGVSTRRESSREDTDLSPLKS